MTSDSLFTGTPSGTNFDDGQPINTGTTFIVNQNCTTTHHRFYAPTTGAGTVTARLYQYTDEENAPTLLAEKAYSAVNANAYNTVAWDTPVALVTGAYYLTQHHASGGHYVGTAAAFGSDVTSANGVLTALANNSSTGVGTLRNGKFKYGSAAFADQNGGGTNFFDDVVIQTSATVTGDGSSAATSTDTALARVVAYASGSSAATGSEAAVGRVVVRAAGSSSATGAETAAARVTVRALLSSAAVSSDTCLIPAAVRGTPIVTTSLRLPLVTVTR